MKIRPKYPLNWTEKGFIRSFPKRIKGLTDSERAAAAIEFAQIFNAELDHISDRPSQMHYIMCAYILALYRTMIAGNWNTNEAIHELREHFKNFGATFIKWSMKIVLWLGIYNRKFVETRALQNVDKQYGNTFSIQEERRENQYTMMISRCGYNDFFKRHGLPELTAIFCEWDRLWADEINQHQGCGIRFTRSETLAEGNNSCRFEFHFDKK